MNCVALVFFFKFVISVPPQDLTMTKFQVSADKQFVLLAYNIQPVSFPPRQPSVSEGDCDLFNKTTLCILP